METNIKEPAIVYFLTLGEKESPRSLAEKTEHVLRCAAFEHIVNNKTLVAIKQHFGEKGNQGHIKPEVTKVVVDMVKARGGLPLLVETNTLYKGNRSNSYNHLMLAHGHGFRIERIGAPIVILDGVNGQNQRPVKIPGEHFSEVHMVTDLPFFDSIFVLSHVKGHMGSGMGGAIKNLAMGFASRAGKLEQHADFKPEIDHDKCTKCEICCSYCPADALTFSDNRLEADLQACIGCGECHVACQSGAISFHWGANDNLFQEKMAEHALGAVINHKGRVAYVNYFSHVSRQCDCWSSENPALYRDVGILASLDPVAVDKASIDIGVEVLGKDVFTEMWPELDALAQVRHAEKIGLGTQEYVLERI